jgi:hypothetical protein
MRHSTIRDKAVLLDRFVDNYMRSRGRESFPHALVEQILPLLFRGSRYEGRGAYKTVFRIKSRNAKRILVLKAGGRRSVRRDMKTYHELRPGIRNRYFARIYWHTRYFVLQKYGKGVKVPKDIVRELKQKTGLRDVRAANIRKVESKFKVVDALPR